MVVVVVVAVLDSVIAVAAELMKIETCTNNATKHLLFDVKTGLHIYPLTHMYIIYIYLPSYKYSTLQCDSALLHNTPF